MSEDRGSDSGPEMIDLPLRPGAGRPDTALEQPIREPADPPGPRPQHPPRRRRSRGGWLPWLIPIIVLGSLAWWFFVPKPALIAVDKAALEFAQERVGNLGERLNVTLSNKGERALVLAAAAVGGDAAGDFSVADDRCAAAELATGQQCEVSVVFQPQSAGARQAFLEFQGKAKNAPFRLPLRATAVAPAVGLAPRSLSFGTVQVGGAPGLQTLTISNIGSAPLQLGRIRIRGAQKDEFVRDRRCPVTVLDPGDACTFEVRFTPTAAGERAAELVIGNDSPGGEAAVGLRGTGVWEGPPFDVEPAGLDFGEQRVGQASRARNLTLRNRSAVAVTASAVEVRPNDQTFTVSEDGCTGKEVPSGGSCSISMTTKPPVEGNVAAVLAVQFGGTAGDLNVDLVSRGVAPRLELQTPRVDFGRQRVGFEGAAQEIVVVNSGSATLSVRGAKARGAAAPSFRVKTIGCRGKEVAPGADCSIRVAFAPGAVGNSAAEIEIEPSDGLEPLRAAVTGTGIAAGLELSSTRLDWGTVALGGGDARALTVRNSGTATLTISRLRIGGAAADDYRTGGIGCQLENGLAPGESCRIAFLFAPGAAGERVAEVEVHHNGTGSPDRVELRGRGEQPRPAFRAEPQRLQFARTPVGGRSDIATVELRNPGTAWLPLHGVSVQGDHAADFELVAGSCTGASRLAPGGDCSVGVRFTPREAGARRAIVSIRHGADGDPGVVELRGSGEAAPE